ncbi:hypothetical protein [Nocardia sp. NPDC003963]
MDSHTNHQVAEVLRGHDTLDNALVAPDQPYNRGGSIRTTFRYWHETTGRGQQQLFTQAQDPQTGIWNLHRYGPPAAAVFLVRYHNGRFGGIEIPVVWWPAGWVAFWLTGIWTHLTADERSRIAQRLGLMKARNEMHWSAWSSLVDHMRQHQLPAFEQMLDIRTHLRPDEYAALARYIRLGGPDLRDEHWFTIPTDSGPAEIESRPADQ